MPRHPDFEAIFQRFVGDYGKEEGTSIYYAYLHNEGFKEEQSMASQKKDAIEGNFNAVQKNLNNFLLTEKAKYTLIVDKFIEDAYNQGMQEAARELSITPNEFGGSREQQKQLNVLKRNSQQLAFNLLEDINKEIGLMITDINLNNIPFTNAQIKKEVQSLFKNKIGRLQSQVVSETTRAFNTALEFGYKKSGVVTHKQWVSIIDGKTTAICQQLNGEIVQIGEPFSAGIYTPPALPNCRSRIVHVTISAKN